MPDSHARSFVKSISWRVLATITTALLVFLFTGSWQISLGVGLFEFWIKILFFYLHERVWHGVKWGRIIK